MSLCECGCGGTAPIAKQTSAARGHIKGQSCRFLPGHNINARMRPDGKSYKRGAGGRHEHVIVAEAALGHSLPGGAEVHHVDENKRNNANGNLVICQDSNYHRLLHVRTRVVRAGGDPNTQRICSRCRELKPFAAFTSHRSICGTCKKTYMEQWRAQRSGVLNAIAQAMKEDEHLRRELHDRR